MSIKVLANEAEILARPYDVDVKKSSVVLTKYLSVQSGKKTRLIPFTEMAIECPTSQCRVTSEKCIISADGIESKKVIGQFDKAVAEFKKHRGHLDDSKAFSYLDQLLVLAMSGDTAAISRFKKFPLEVDGGAAEIFETYKMYLQESESLNCAKKNL